MILKKMNNAGFGKTKNNAKKDKDFKYVINYKKKLFIIRIKPRYYKVFHENLSATKMRKTQILMNKPNYLVYQY